MSSNFDANGYGREIAFATGAFLGTLTFAVGMATLILAMSVGLRRGEEYLDPTTKMTLLGLGAVMVVTGVLFRLYRGTVTTRFESEAATGGTIAALIGAALVLFASSAEVTVSAPFLSSPKEKVLLFAIAYVLVAIGLVLLRFAAKMVGW